MFLTVYQHIRMEFHPCLGCGSVEIAEHDEMGITWCESCGEVFEDSGGTYGNV